MVLTQPVNRCRREIMGFAAIMLIFFHSYAVLPIRILNLTLVKHGNIGVDIFVFLSGYGCVHSLAKSPDLRSFMRRRFRRILPPYYVAMAMVIALGGWRQPAAMVAHLIPVTVWSGQNSSFWYVSMALTLYFMIPVIDEMLVRVRYPRITFLGMLAVASFAMPCVIHHKETTLAVMRFPAAVVGVGMARLELMASDARDRRINTALFTLLFAAAVLIWLLGDRFYGDVPALLTPYQATYYRLAVNGAPLAVLLGTVFMLLERIRWLRFVNAALRWIGDLSLEIYLSHLLIRHAMMTCFDFEGIRLLIAMLVLACPLALAIKWLGKRALALTDRLFLKAEA